MDVPYNRNIIEQLTRFTKCPWCGGDLCKVTDDLYQSHAACHCIYELSKRIEILEKKNVTTS